MVPGTSPGVHPTSGLRVRANSKVSVHHLSWMLVLSEAVKEHAHRGVEDPEQAWILGELIRYLSHPKSGTLEFTDMGDNWTTVRQDLKPFVPRAPAIERPGKTAADESRGLASASAPGTQNRELVADALDDSDQRVVRA